MLHPQAQALLRLMEEKGVAPPHTLDPAEARRQYRERAGYTQPARPEVALVKDIVIGAPHGAIPARFFRPAASRAGEALPVLVYFHGGGWVIGDLDTHETLCRELCNGAGCAVVSVDYRLAPEHRFPAAVDDAAAALAWVAAHADELQVDASRIAVGGDSAGGNLAAIAAIEARDRGPVLRFQLLIYPVTDLRRGSDSYRTLATGYSLGAETMAYFCAHYLGPDEAAHAAGWRASPLLHEDLSGLPPALVLVAGYDPLHDEGVQYADRLSAAGNTATLVDFPRQMHGFILLGKVIDEANTAVQVCAAQLKLALA